MSIEVNLDQQEHVDPGADVVSAAEQVRETELYAQAFAGQDLEPPVIPKQLHARHDDTALAERPAAAGASDHGRVTEPASAEHLPMTGRVVGTKAEPVVSGEPDAAVAEIEASPKVDATETAQKSPYYELLESQGDAGTALEPYLTKLAIVKDDYVDRVRGHGADEGDELDQDLLDRLGHEDGAQDNSNAHQLTDVLGRSLQELQARPELVADGGEVNWLGLGTSLLDKAAALGEDADSTERDGLLVSATTAVLMADNPEDRLAFLERTATHGLSGHMENALDHSDVTVILGGYRNADIRSISGPHERSIQRIRSFSHAFAVDAELVGRYRQLVQRDIEPQHDAHAAMKEAADDYDTPDGISQNGHAERLEAASVAAPYVDKYRIDPTKAERFALEEEFVRAQMADLFPNGDTTELRLRLASGRPADPSTDADTSLRQLFSNALTVIEEASQATADRFNAPGGDPTEEWSREQLIAWRYQQLSNTGAAYDYIAKFVDPTIYGRISNFGSDVYGISQNGAALPAISTETVRVVLDIAKTYTASSRDRVTPEELRDLTQANRRQLMKIAAINIDHLSATLVNDNIRNQTPFSKQPPSPTEAKMYRKIDGTLALDGRIFQTDKASTQAATRLACVALRVNVEGRPADADTMVRNKTNSIELLSEVLIDEAFERGIFGADPEIAYRPEPLLTQEQEVEFNRMYVQYNGFLTGIVRRMGVSEQDTEDIINETFLATARSGSGRIFNPDSDDNERAYLARAAQNAAINHFRKGQRRPPTTSDPEANELGLLNAEQPGPGIEQLVASNDVRERLFAEWRGLMPDRHFKILIMNGYYGMEYKEIAEQLDVPIGTVMSSLHRAKAAIKEHEKQKAEQAQ